MAKTWEPDTRAGAGAAVVARTTAAGVATGVADGAVPAGAVAAGAVVAGAVVAEATVLDRDPAGAPSAPGPAGSYWLTLTPSLICSASPVAEWACTTP